MSSVKLPASIQGHQRLLKDLEIRAGRRAIDFHAAFKVFDSLPVPRCLGRWLQQLDGLTIGPQG